MAERYTRLLALSELISLDLETVMLLRGKNPGSRDMSDDKKKLILLRDNEFFDKIKQLGRARGLHDPQRVMVNGLHKFINGEKSAASPERKQDETSGTTYGLVPHRGKRLLQDIDIDNFMSKLKCREMFEMADIADIGFPRRFARKELASHLIDVVQSMPKLQERIKDKRSFITNWKTTANASDTDLAIEILREFINERKRAKQQQYSAMTCSGKNEIAPKVGAGYRDCATGYTRLENDKGCCQLISSLGGDDWVKLQQAIATSLKLTPDHADVRSQFAELIDAEPADQRSKVARLVTEFRSNLSKRLTRLFVGEMTHIQETSRKTLCELEEDEYARQNQGILKRTFSTVTEYLKSLFTGDGTVVGMIVATLALLKRIGKTTIGIIDKALEVTASIGEKARAVTLYFMSFPGVSTVLISVLTTVRGVFCTEFGKMLSDPRYGFANALYGFVSDTKSAMSVADTYTIHSNREATESTLRSELKLYAAQKQENEVAAKEHRMPSVVQPSWFDTLSETARRILVPPVTAAKEVGDNTGVLDVAKNHVVRNVVSTGTGLLVGAGLVETGLPMFATVTGGLATAVTSQISLAVKDTMSSAMILNNVIVSWRRVFDLLDIETCLAYMPLHARARLLPAVRGFKLALGIRTSDEQILRNVTTDFDSGSVYIPEDNKESYLAMMRKTFNDTPAWISDKPLPPKHQEKARSQLYFNLFVECLALDFVSHARELNEQQMRDYGIDEYVPLSENLFTKQQQLAAITQLKSALTNLQEYHVKQIKVFNDYMLVNGQDMSKIPDANSITSPFLNVTPVGANVQTANTTATRH